MPKIKPVKPGPGTPNKPAEVATTESRQIKGPTINRNESRQTKKLAANRNESRQTKGTYLNRNESLARGGDPWDLVEAGHYDAAVPLLRDAAKAAEGEFGSDARETAVAFNQLGVACTFGGRFDEARAAYAGALPVAEAAAGAEPDLLAALLHNLGGLSHSRRRYAEAEAYARRGLTIREKHGDAPALAADLAALAAILEGQERWNEAEGLYRRALTMWEAEGDNYETAMTLNGLAAVIRFQGRPDEAERLFRQALSTVEAERGPRHPDSSTIRNNLAMLLNATGRARTALPLLEQAVKDLYAILGPDHPASRDVRANRDRIAASLRTSDTGSTSITVPPGSHRQPGEGRPSAHPGGISRS